MADNTPIEITTLNQLVDNFKKNLMGPDSPRGELWKAWHFLQVYATWGVRLPADAEALKSTIGLDNPADYPFFPIMLGGTQEINESCHNFLNQTFPAVESLGKDLKAFAEDNRSGNDSIWAEIQEMMEDEENFPDVLEFIKDLQSKAAENATNADRVAILLSSFSTGLESANGKLKTALQQVNNDDRTSQATIDNLSKGEDVAGSILNVEKLATEMKGQYNHNMVVAATSPSYAWVFPFGTIAAAVIAGVYGKRAVDALNNYEKLMASAEEKSAKLATAIKTRSVHNLASKSLTNIREQTALAITQITIVKNAWSTLSGNLNQVADKVKDMTYKKGDKVKGKRVVNRYANQAAKAWEELWPTIVELTSDPYINVEDNDKTVSQIVQEIELAMANPAAAN